MSNPRVLRLLASALPCLIAIAVPGPAASREASARIPLAWSGAEPAAWSAARGAGANPLDAGNVLAALGNPIGWVEQKVMAANGQPNDLFGFRTLVVGDLAFISAPAPGPAPGSVYVYERGSKGWEERQRISATPADGTPPNWSDFFGWSLAVSGDRLLVGAPQVFHPMYGPVGGAFLFTRESNGEWTQAATFMSPIPGTLDWFGQAVAFADDTILVGEPIYDRNGPASRGATHVFNEIGGTWTLTQTVEASDGAQFDGRNFGGAIAASADGSVVAIGSPGPDWSSADYPEGTVYIFSNTGGTLAETGLLQASDSVPGNQFGFSVAIDGDRLLVGAPGSTIGSNAGQGAAYVFERNAGSFSEVQKLFDEAGEAFDQFGQAVAVEGGLAAIGMWRHNDEPGGTQPAPKAGTVHVYAATGPAWTPLSTLSGSDAASDQDDSFGWHVAVDGDTILVGADADSSVATFGGSAYFYSRDSLFADGFEAVEAP